MLFASLYSSLTSLLPGSYSQSWEPSLVDKGVDANAQGGRYGKALYAASVRGYDKVVQLLVDNGADIQYARWKVWQRTPSGFIRRPRGRGAATAG